MTVCIVSFRYKTLGNDWIKSSYPNVDFIVNATMTDTSGDGGWEEGRRRLGRGLEEGRRKLGGG